MESNELFVKTNEVNSNVTELIFKEYWKSCSDPFDREFFSKEKIINEIRDTFLDFFYSVPFIQNCTSVDRKYAKDLPRDNKGRIVVDITHPHILEDMAYFRPTALCFDQYGVPTLLKPNGNPNSPYGKWIAEEARRCREGYIRESDGEWVTGDLYFFWNYAPMLVEEEDEDEGITTRYRRFPSVWEGHYWKAHYIWQARHNSKNSAELASRAKGKTAFGAAMLGRRILLGETTKNKTDVTCVAMASDKKFLTGGDVLLDKFQDILDFCGENTEFPRGRLKDTENELKWEIGYKRNNGPKGGIQNVVFGITSGNTPKKGRGSRAALYILEEFGSWANLKPVYNGLKPSVKNGKKAYGIIHMQGCVCAGTKVWTKEGRYVNIEELKKEDGIIGFSNIPYLGEYINTYGNGITKEPISQFINLGQKECIRVTLANGNILECSIDHPIYIQKRHSKRINGNSTRALYYTEQFQRADSLRVGDRVCECRAISIFGQDTLFDARLVGMLIGDGSYGFDHTPKFSSEDSELLNYIKNNYQWGLSATHITKKGNVYEDIRVKGICKNLREIGIYGQTKLAKRLPNNYQTLTKEQVCLLLSGLYDTDGNIYSKGLNSSIRISQSNRLILEQIQLLWRKFGVIGSIKKELPNIAPNSKDKNCWYTLTIAGRYNLQRAAKVLDLLVPHKKLALIQISNYFEVYITEKERKEYFNEDFIVSKITKIESLGVKTIYNLCAGFSHTYLANNIITHNTAGDSESDFSSAQDLVRNPDGNDIYAVDNVYDKVAQGKKRFPYFFPGYINLQGFYDKNGNSDVVKALVEIIAIRIKIKYNTDNPDTLVRAIAETPIVPEEAMLRVQSNVFPTADLNNRIAEIEGEPNALNDVFVGDLVMDANGEVSFKTTNDVPIRFFPHKDNKLKGAVEIFEMPQKAPNESKPASNRYIASCDPVDKDSADSVSLSSTFVLDLYTDKIVAEYTGRKDFAEDAYEVTRRLCMFYNARCLYENNIPGLYGYFSKMNCTYLLADTPEYLKEKDLIKTNTIGNGSKGVRTTVPIINHGEQLIRDWLCKEVTINNQTEHSEEIQKTSNLYLIKNLALLKELSQYNRLNNFDRVMSLMMLMIYRESMMILFHGEVKVSKQRDDPNYLGNSKFFQQYDRKFRKN